MQNKDWHKNGQYFNNWTSIWEQLEQGDWTLDCLSRWWQVCNLYSYNWCWLPENSLPPHLLNKSFKMLMHKSRFIYKTFVINHCSFPRQHYKQKTQTASMEVYSIYCTSYMKSTSRSQTITASTESLHWNSSMKSFNEEFHQRTETYK